MNKIQFYPDDDLYKKLDEMSKDCGISISALVQDVLRNTLCLELRKTKGEVELTKAVLSEVTNFIIDKDCGYEFDLMNASETYANIKDTETIKANSIRAKIGNNFANIIGKSERFKNVAVAINRNGNTKRNQNNAIIYKIVTL